MICIHVTPQCCKMKELDMVLVKGQMKQKNERENWGESNKVVLKFVCFLRNKHAHWQKPYQQLHCICSRK